MTSVISLQLSPSAVLAFFASVLDSDYSASVSSFPLSSYLRLTATLTALVFHFRFLRFPRYLLPDFSCIPSRFWYLYLLFVSFHPSLIRSHSCSSGACFQLASSTFSVSLPFSFVHFRLLPTTQPSVSPFPFYCSCLTAAFSASVSAFASSFSPLSLA